VRNRFKLIPQRTRNPIGPGTLAQFPQVTPIRSAGPATSLEFFCHVPDIRTNAPAAMPPESNLMYGSVTCTKLPAWSATGAEEIALRPRWTIFTIPNRPSIVTGRPSKAVKSWFKSSIVTTGARWSALGKGSLAAWANQRRAMANSAGQPASQAT